ncbi:hypothetical protein [Streptosporangium sp. NPDC048865]
MTRDQLIATITGCCASGDIDLLASVDTADADDLRDFVASCPTPHGEEP